MSDPKVAAVPVAECSERLVDVRRVSSLLVDDRKQQDSADTFAYLREGVLNRLLTAEASLSEGPCADPWPGPLREHPATQPPLMPVSVKPRVRWRLD